MLLLPNKAASCEVLLTQNVVLLPRPESVSFLVFPIDFLLKKSTKLPNGWLIPFHLTTALAAGSSAGSSSFWCLEKKTLGKEAKLLFWRWLWEPLHVGCSCWHSRESGKIVVNPPGEGGCFMPSPPGCWWGQPRAGRDTCSTGIVPFFGLATEGGKGGRAIKIRKRNPRCGVGSVYGTWMRFCFSETQDFPLGLRFCFAASADSSQILL